MSIGCVAVFCLIPPIDIDAEPNEDTYVYVSHKGEEIAASFLALFTPRRSRDRLSASTGKSYARRNFVPVDFSLVYLANLGF